MLLLQQKFTRSHIRTSSLKSIRALLHIVITYRCARVIVVKHTHIILVHNNNNNNNKIGNVLNTQLFRNSIVATCNHASIPANTHTNSCMYGVFVRRLVVVV